MGNVSPPDARCRCPSQRSASPWPGGSHRYAALDPSYADQASFGFCVDVGNGFTTLVPSVLFAVSITSPLLDARHLGMLGLVMFWQEFYGTCVYFFQYFFLSLIHI